MAQWREGRRPIEKSTPGCDTRATLADVFFTAVQAVFRRYLETMLRKFAWTGVFVTAFVVNPNLACSSDPDGDFDGEFDYGEAEMEQGVVGTYSGTAEGSDEAITLVVRRAPAPRGSNGATSLRPQCGSRSFVAPAGACISMSSMALEGELTSSAGTFDATLTGTFEAYRTLDSANLSLSDKAAVLVSADYTGGKLQCFRFRRGSAAEIALDLERQ